MNRREDVKKVMKTIENLLHNNNVKIEEIKQETGLTRAKLSYLKNGHKSIDSLTLLEAEQLCSLSDRIKRGTYIPEKVKVRQRNEQKKEAERQALNKREYNELTDRQKQMLEDSGIDITLYYQRRYRGWSFKEIVNRPVRKKKYLTSEEKQQLQENGISESTFYARISRGWERKRAIHEKINR